MSYYVIVRGPLGVGKSTVSQELARRLGAERISVDRILEDHDLWYRGRLAEFLKTNEIAGRRAARLLRAGTPVVFDGNFYWKTQIRDLVRRLDFQHVIFTLKAPLRICVERDRRRVTPQGSEAARAVYAKSTRFDSGIGVDATRPLDRVVEQMVLRVSRRRSAPPAKRPSHGSPRGRRAARSTRRRQERRRA